jgi:hypothetical protein
MGEFTVTMSEEDLYRGFLLNGANRKVRPVMMAAAFLFALLAIIAWASPSARYSLSANPLTLMLEGAVLLALTMLMLVLLLRRTILRSMARRTLEQRRELATPVQWSFDEEALSVVTRFTSSRFPWDALRGWREDERILLVYLADQLFHSVPKHQVEEATLIALRAALESHGVPKR